MLCFKQFCCYLFCVCVYQNLNKTTVFININWDMDTYSNSFFTPPLNRNKVTFSFKFVCVSVCLSMHACLSVSEHNSSQMQAPILCGFLWLFTTQDCTLSELVILGQKVAKMYVCSLFIVIDNFIRTHFGKKSSKFYNWTTDKTVV